MSSESFWESSLAMYNWTPMTSDATFYTCCFCNEKFVENEKFWAHMSAGNCETKAELPPPPPLTVQVNNSHLNEGKGATSHAFTRPTPQPFTPSPSISSAVTTTTTVIATSGVVDCSDSTAAYDFTQMTTAVPYFSRYSAQQQPPRQEVPLPCKQNAENVPPPLPKINSQPAITSPTSAPKISTSYDKWKCTLCNVSFSDKTQLMLHLNSPEHESRLPANPIASKAFPRPSSTTNGAIAAQPPPVAPTLPCPSNSQSAFAANVNGQAPFLSQGQQSQSPPLPNQEALAQMIRKIFMEEIRPLVREEIRCLLRPLFQDQSSSATASPVERVDSNNNGAAAVAASSGVLEPRGVGYFCHACNCPVPSQVNLQMHCSGKRHKAALEKMSF
nr:unnamed protein product [Spirometra erinaceieuropaei]